MVTYDQVQEMLCNDYYLAYNDLDNNLIKNIKRLVRKRVLYYPYKRRASIYDL